MTGLDDHIARLGQDAGLLLALAAALLLGLRHATDPDHLTAVSMLVFDDERQGTKRAARLGLLWGLGHAVTLLALGLPVVWLHRELPEPIRRTTEALVGVAICVLALRLLVRWRRGVFHLHPHEHGGTWHVHPHAHASRHELDHHAHAHVEGPGRSALASFGMGLLHGIGGSAAAGLLLAGAFPTRASSAMALVVFASGTALSMGLLSAGFGGALARRFFVRRLELFAPAIGGAGLLFGLSYMVAAAS